MILFSNWPGPSIPDSWIRNGTEVKLTYLLYPKELHLIVNREIWKYYLVHYWIMLLTFIERCSFHSGGPFISFRIDMLLFFPAPMRFNSNSKKTKRKVLRKSFSRLTWFAISTREPVLDDLLSWDGVLGRLSVRPCLSGEPPSDEATDPRRDEWRECGREQGRDVPPSAKVRGGSTSTSRPSIFFAGLLFASLMTKGGGRDAVGKGEMGRDDEAEDNFWKDGMEPGWERKKLR